MLPILLHIGPFTLHAYGLLVALGVFAGIHVLIRQAALDGFTGEKVRDALNGLAIHMIVAGVLGARIFYVATHSEEFSGNWISIFYIWQGGLIFYGGLILAMAAFFLWHKKNQSLFPNWMQVADWLAPSLAFGHALGRIGCLMAGCCFGKACGLPWAVTFTNPDSLAPIGVPLHPTQLYETIFLLCLGLFLTWRLKQARTSPSHPRHGFIFLDYILIYSMGRFLIEFLRGDGDRFYMLSAGQLVSIVIWVTVGAIRLKKRLDTGKSELVQ